MNKEKIELIGKDKQIESVRKKKRKMEKKRKK